MPPRFPRSVVTMWSMLVDGRMIGIDQRKGSHTAVAITAAEQPLAELRVRASAAQGARGLGHLLGQQLVAAGERVLDVQPKPAARVRLLGGGIRTRTTRTTRCRLPWRRCAPGPGAR